MVNQIERDILAGLGKKVIPSKELFGDGKEVFIQHGDLTYRLMITRQGKLILNK